MMVKLAKAKLAYSSQQLGNKQRSKSNDSDNINNINSNQLSYKALFFMALLSIQFGIQPIVTKRYISPNIIKSTIIFMQEIVKLCLGVVGISFGNVSWANVVDGWTITSWLRLALLPATIYLVQNMCSLLAYQNLDAITYNVLNQTKTLSAAVCCYLFLNKRQSSAQIIALLLLLLAALVMEKVISLESLIIPYYWITGSSSSSSSSSDNNTGHYLHDISPRHFSHGVFPIIIASFLSGLAGAITQKSLQHGNRKNALLFTIELCVASILLLFATSLISNDGRQIQQYGFFHEWTIYTCIPILTNSLGGILVGLVIKYAGTVRKGFALIFGIVLSGVVQSLIDVDKTLSKEDVIGGLLAGGSLWLHSTNPYVATPVKSKED